MRKLAKAERLRLLEFVCSFAWADLKVSDAEREVIRALIVRLHLDDDERAKVESWLVQPPPIDEIDPTSIPREHRSLFYESVRELCLADGLVESERDTLDVFARLLLDGGERS